MKSALIVVGSRYGQTVKIAERIEHELGKDSVSATLLRLPERGPSPTVQVGAYDLVVVGCPVYAGKYCTEVIKWTNENRGALSGMTSAFFSVSLNAADKRPQMRKEDDRLLREFLDETGLRPQYVASVAGTLHYRQYNFIIRTMLKNISKKAGGPTDTSRDWEMTDWQQVESFARDLATLNVDSPFLTSRRLQVA